MLIVHQHYDVLAQLVHHGFTQLPSLLEAWADGLHQLLQHRAQVRLHRLTAQLLCWLRYFGWREKLNVYSQNTTMHHSSARVWQSASGRYLWLSPPAAIGTRGSGPCRSGWEPPAAGAMFDIPPSVRKVPPADAPGSGCRPPPPSGQNPVINQRSMISAILICYC